MAVRIPEFVVYIRDADRGARASDQLFAVRDYVRSRRGDVIAEYRGDSPDSSSFSELRRALDHAQQRGATLVLPRFEHIARESAPLALLRDSGVEFVALDYPEADQASLPLLVAVMTNQVQTAHKATQARRLKERRSKAKPSRARPSTRPRPPPSMADRRKGAAVVGRRARQDAERLGPRLRELRDEGLSLREIATRIGDEGGITRTGRPVSHTAVRRLLARYDAIQAARRTIL